MNGFLRTLVVGLAAMGVVFLVAGAVVMSKVNGLGWNNDKLREQLLTEDEKKWLARMHEPPKSMPPFQGPALSVDEALRQLAEVANAQHANDLVRDLRVRASSLADREADVARREAELQLVRAEVARLQRALDTQTAQLSERERALAQERSEWAKRQLADTDKLQALTAAEKARYQEQAKLFEQMKDNAWQSLRRFPPDEIARYLAFMDGKKAARMLVLAQQDADQPDMAVKIHKAQMRLDLSGASETQIDRLAGLYALMPAAQVLPYLAGSSDREVADIFVAMAKGGNLKQRAALQQALTASNAPRAMSIQRLVEQATVPASGG